METVVEDVTILDRMTRHARETPDRVAYRFLHDDGRVEVLTFGQLDQSVRTLARHFRRHASISDRAVLLYPPGLDFIEAFLGCLAAGIVAVPCHPPRRNRSADRLRTILHDAQPRIVLGSQKILAALMLDGFGSVDRSRWLATDVIDTGSADDWSSHDARRETVAFLQYTSGSTGTPRGVVVTHGNIAANERTIEVSYRHTRDSVMVSWLPLFHDMGLIGGVLQPLYVGFPAILLSPVSFLREPVRWLRAISEYRGTTSGGPNFAYDHCVKSITREQRHGLDLSCWSIAYNGAEPVRAETLDRFSTAFASYGFRPEAFYPCYGLAESTLFVSGGPPDLGPARVWICGKALEGNRVVAATAECVDPREFVGSGQISDETRVVIADPETDNECAPDKVGEVWLASASMAQGYWDRPGESQEVFRAHLAGTGDGPFLRTGDAGFVRNGELFITGRLKDVIIIRGRNLYPQDIETAVEQVVPFARTNAVAAFPVEVGGGERLAVVIEANRSLAHAASDAAKGRASASGTHESISVLEDLVGLVRRTIVEEFEVPVHAVAFVRPGCFPRTSSGKVQRRACRSGFLEGLLDIVHIWRERPAKLESADRPTSDEPRSPGTDLATQQASGRPHHHMPGASGFDHGAKDRADEMRRIIHDIVLDHLRSEVDHELDGIGHHDSMISLGLDSLGAAAIAVGIEEATGHRLTPDAIYECQTIYQLAEYLVRMEAPAAEDARGPSSPMGKRLASTVAAVGRTIPPDSLLDRYIELNQRIDRLKQDGRYPYELSQNAYEGGTWVVSKGKRMLMLSSFSYLGMLGDPAVNEAAKRGIDLYGATCHGSRLVAGTIAPHRELERRLAERLGTEDAMLFNTGYLANLATVSALARPGDVVIGDKFNHASLSDGCRFSGAEFLSTDHNDLEMLETLLSRTRARKFVFVDAVYSMEGDLAPLPAIADLCRRYEALLMVDEAHSFGVLGATGCGLREHLGLPADSVDVTMTTLSKSLGSCGGVVAGRREMIRYLKHHARGFVFTVALPPPSVMAALKALELMESEPGRRERVWRNAGRLISGLQGQGFTLTPTQTPIVPVLCDSEERALDMAARCREDGLYVVPIFYPAVPMNAPRIRLSVSAAHTDADIDLALEILGRVGREVGLIT